MATRFDENWLLHRLFYEPKHEVEFELRNLMESTAIKRYHLDQLPSGPIFEEAAKAGLCSADVVLLLKKGTERALQGPETPERKARLAIWMIQHGEGEVSFEHPLGGGKEADVVGRHTGMLGEVGKTSVQRFSYAINNNYNKILILEARTMNLHVFDINAHAQMVFWQVNYLLSLQGSARRARN